MKKLFSSANLSFSLISLILLFLHNNIFSQNSLFLKYPGLKITPEDFIPSPSQAVGYMQFSYDNPVRDLFITPGKSIPNFKAIGFLSYQFFKDDYKYKATSYPARSENYESIFHKNHFPAGAVLNLYGITFGFLYGYGTIPIEQRQDNNNIGQPDDTLLTKGKNNYYNLSFSINPISSLNFGLSYSSHNFKRDYAHKYQDFNINYFIPDELIAGLGYTFFDKLRVYLAYGKYKINNEEKRTERFTPYRTTTVAFNYDGNLVNLDLKYAFDENLNLFLRTAYDSRKINWKEERIRPSGQSGPNRFQEGNARNYKIGTGINYKVDKIKVFSEFNYEPGYFNLQYVTTTVTWDPPVSGNEINYYDWNFGLGVEIQVFDFVKLQLGNRYYKIQRKLTQEIDLNKYSTFDPDITTSNNIITAGTEIRLFNFVFNYVFNHSSYQNYFIPKLSPFPVINFREFNPIQHKFLVRYEF